MEFECYSLVYCFLVVFGLSSGAIDDSIDPLPDYIPEDELDCQLDPTKFLTQIQVPWGSPGRAQRSVPPELHLAASSIPAAGLGIFTTTFISKFTWLGEFEGETVIENGHISDYAWEIRRGGKELFYVDAYDEATSNWLRYVNCARHSKEENVMFVACRSRPFYLTVRDLYPGQELLVYYGHEYAKTLDIDVHHFYNEDVNWGLFKRYACPNIQ